VVDGPRRWTLAEFNAWVNQLAPGWPHWAEGIPLFILLLLLLFSSPSSQQRRIPRRVYACAKLGLVLRAHKPGLAARTRWPTFGPLASPAAWWPRASCSRTSATPSRRCRPDADVFLAPRHRRPRTRRSPPTVPGPAGRVGQLAQPSWSTAEPDRFVDDRDASATSTLRNHLFPQGRGSARTCEFYTESRLSSAPGSVLDSPTVPRLMLCFHTAQLNAFCTPAIMVGANIPCCAASTPERCST